MRYSSPELLSVLTEGSFDHWWEADLYYDGARLKAAIPIKDVVFREDASSTVQQSGAVTVEWTDEFATSLTPRKVTDPLAPFGAQLYVYCIVEAGTFVERVEFGRFEIVDVPAARDEQMRFRDEWITIGSTVQLELRDLLSGLSRERFDAPTTPESLASAWAEIARISGLPVERTVPDAEIPRSIMYPESRLDAINDLMGVVLDAAPHMTADGSLAARPNSWPDPVQTITLGNLVDVGGTMSAEGVYNRVVVRAVDGNQVSILAAAEVPSGPLRVRNPDGSRSPFGIRTMFLSSELVTTKTQAQGWADSTLEQVSTFRARVIPVVEKFNPLRERGDVVLIERPTEWLLARVGSIDRSDHETQTFTAEVRASLPNRPPELIPYPSSGTYPGDDVFPGGDA